MDTLLYSNTNSDIITYGVLRRRCKSTLLVQFLNRFGQQDGFKKILDRINLVSNDYLSLDLISNYLECLVNCTGMYNKVFLTEYLPMLD